MSCMGHLEQGGLRPGGGRLGRLLPPLVLCGKDEDLFLQLLNTFMTPAFEGFLFCSEIWGGGPGARLPRCVCNGCPLLPW